MKNTFKLFGIIAIIALALTACFSLWKGDEAVITLYLGGGAGGRAAMKYPPDNDIRGNLVHIVQLSGPDGDQTIEFEKGALTAKITVVPGRWAITVNAFLDDKLSDIYAEGSRSVNLIAGRNNKVEIEMQYAMAEVPGDSLTEKLNWLEKYAQSDRSYVLEIDKDESIAPHGLSYGGRNITITLKGIDADKTVSLSSNGAMFYVDSGVTLILDNITLEGLEENTAPLVSIGSGGTLTMDTCSAITGNTSIDGWGGGVWMDKDGNLTMNGTAKIFGNTAANAGGVCVNGNLTMNNDAEISGNTAKKGSGGGVFVSEYGTFTMTGGVISGNTAEEGGGVCVWRGTFRIVTGIIYGSDDPGQNAANSGAALAVAEGAAQHGTFVSGTWKIEGTLSTNDKTINVKNGKTQ